MTPREFWWIYDGKTRAAKGSKPERMTADDVAAMKDKVRDKMAAKGIAV